MLQTLIHERVWGRPLGALQTWEYCAPARAIAKKILCSSIIPDADTQHATRSERTPECDRGRGLRVRNMPGPTYMYWCCTAPAAPAPVPISQCQKGLREPLCSRLHDVGACALAPSVVCSRALD
jgi:hypothetical protein